MGKHKNFVPRETFLPKNLDLSEKGFNFAPKLKTYGSERNS